MEGRLKKIDALKQDLAPGLEGMDYLLQTTYGKDVLRTLTESCSTNIYKKKQMVYWEGNHPNRLYYVLRGKVKAYKSNEDGKELVTELFSPGDFLGYVALLEGTVYKDNAQALEETELAVIPKEDFDELVNNNKEVSQKFMKLLARNVSAKEDLLLGVAYNSLRKKVANALLTLQHKYQVKNEVEFVLNINRESLANVAGTAKESLIRTLSDFRNEKLIEINKDGSIIITNQHKLEQLLN